MDIQLLCEPAVLNLDILPQGHYVLYLVLAVINHIITVRTNTYSVFDFKTELFYKEQKIVPTKLDFNFLYQTQYCSNNKDCSQKLIGNNYNNNNNSRFCYATYQAHKIEVQKPFIFITIYKFIPHFLTYSTTDY